MIIRASLSVIIYLLAIGSALACNDIYFLRDGRKIHTAHPSSNDGRCLEVAHGIVESPLKDGVYHLKEGGSGVVLNGCWARLSEGAVLESGEHIFTAVFNELGESPYVLYQEQFTPLKDGAYKVKESGHAFTVTNGVIDDYGGFDKEGRLIFEDRN